MKSIIIKIKTSIIKNFKLWLEVNQLPSVYKPTRVISILVIIFLSIVSILFTVNSETLLLKGSILGLCSLLTFSFTLYLISNVFVRCYNMFIRVFIYFYNDKLESTKSRVIFYYIQNTICLVLSCILIYRLHYNLVSYNYEYEGWFIILSFLVGFNFALMHVDYTSGSRILIISVDLGRLAIIVNIFSLLILIYCSIKLVMFGIDNVTSSEQYKSFIIKNSRSYMFPHQPSSSYFNENLQENIAESNFLDKKDYLLIKNNLRNDFPLSKRVTPLTLIIPTNPVTSTLSSSPSSTILSPSSLSPLSTPLVNTSSTGISLTLFDSSSVDSSETSIFKSILLKGKKSYTNLKNSITSSLTRSPVSPSSTVVDLAKQLPPLPSSNSSVISSPSNSVIYNFPVAPSSYSSIFTLPPSYSSSILNSPVDPLPFSPKDVIWSFNLNQDIVTLEALESCISLPMSSSQMLDVLDFKSAMEILNTTEYLDRTTYNYMFHELFDNYKGTYNHSLNNRIIVREGDTYDSIRNNVMEKTNYKKIKLWKECYLQINGLDNVMQESSITPVSLEPFVSDDNASTHSTVKFRHSNDSDSTITQTQTTNYDHLESFLP